MEKNRLLLLLFVLVLNSALIAVNPPVGCYVFTNGGANSKWSTAANWSIADGNGSYTGVATNVPTNATSVWIPLDQNVTLSAAAGCKSCYLEGSLTTASAAFIVDGDLTVIGTLNANSTAINCTNCTITSTGTLKYPDPSETTTSSCKLIVGYVKAYEQKGNDANYAYPLAVLQNDGTLKNVIIQIGSNCQKLIIQGNPVQTPTLSGILVGSLATNIPQEIVLDQDVKIQKYSTKALTANNYYGGIIALATNSSYDFSTSDPTKVSGDKKFTLNAGRKITFMDEYSGLGFRRHASPMKAYSTTGSFGNVEKWTYNINGTIDASLGFVNLCSTIGDTDLSNTLTLNNNGTIICGKWVREHSGQASGNYVVVNNLGSIKYTEVESYYTTNVCAVDGARVGSYAYGASSSEVTNSLISPYVTTALRTAVNNKQYSYSVKNRVITLQHLVVNDVVKVYNVNGQMLYSTRSMANSIDILMKNAGVYFVQITSGHKRENLKVTVM